MNEILREVLERVDKIGMKLDEGNRTHCDHCREAMLMLKFLYLDIKHTVDTDALELRSSVVKYRSGRIES